MQDILKTKIYTLIRKITSPLLNEKKNALHTSRRSPERRQ